MKKLSLKNHIPLLLIVASLALTPFFVQAQGQEPAAPAADSKPEGILNNEPPPPKAGYEENSGRQANYIYERPTLEKFSQLYWAIGKFTAKSDKEIDNYLMINECDIYRDYHNNEFEWAKVRETARKFLEYNKSQFPLRFEFVQPLKLGKYDLEKQQFEIADAFKIDGIRRFEVPADNFYSDVCGFDRSRRGLNIEGYPRGLLVELNRPVIPSLIPVGKETAKKYINEKMEKFKGLAADQQKESNLYLFRDAYMYMRVKVFAYKGERRNEAGKNHAEVMAILESFEIFGDKSSKMLLYKEDYKRKREDRRGFKKGKGAAQLELPDPNPNNYESEEDSEQIKDSSEPAKIEIPEYNPSSVDE